MYLMHTSFRDVLEMFNGIEFGWTYWPGQGVNLGRGYSGDMQLSVALEKCLISLVDPWNNTGGQDKVHITQCCQISKTVVNCDKPYSHTQESWLSPAHSIPTIRLCHTDLDVAWCLLHEEKCANICTEHASLKRDFAKNIN